MSKILIGAVLALLGTIVVQLFVIPRVARQTRALDRWEKDAYELMILVNEDLVVSLAALDQQSGVAFSGQPGAEEHEESFWAKYGDVRDILLKITQRVRRCTMVAPRAPYWASLLNSQQQVWNELRALNAEIRTGKPDMPTRMTALHASNDQLSEMLRRITEPIEPPEQPAWWRNAVVRQRLSRIKSIRALSAAIGQRRGRP